MVLKNNINDREMNKFQETVTGDHAVRVIPFGTLDIPDGADFIAATYPDTVTEVYTYKQGGSGGSTLKTVTVIYTDTTKDNLLSVAWS